MHKDRDANINSLVLSIQILCLRGHGIIQRGSTITESSSYPIISFLFEFGPTISYSLPEHIYTGPNEPRRI